MYKRTISHADGIHSIPEVCTACIVRKSFQTFQNEVYHRKYNFPREQIRVSSAKPQSYQFFHSKKQASTTLLAIAASPIAKGSATAEPTADADAFFGRNFYQPQQQWGLTSYSNNWNQRYNPQQMWGAQSGYLNNHYGKRSVDAKPTADAFFGRSFYQPLQQWVLTSYSNNWN